MGKTLPAVEYGREGQLVPQNEKIKQSQSTEAIAEQ
jgi:hypothetical protein